LSYRRDPFNNMFSEFDNLFSDPFRMDHLRNQQSLYDPFRNMDMMDPFRSYHQQHQLDDPFRRRDTFEDNEDVLRGTENSYVTKINYDREGNPVKEVLQTKVFHANDKGQKIMEKEKRYINDSLGEEKISKEKNTRRQGN